MSFRWLPLLFFALALQAFAHTEAQAPADGLLDCEHPPNDLAAALPKQLAASAAVLCMPTTQMIVAGDGWVWRFPGSFFDRPSIPAYSPMQSRSQASGRYFTRFTAEELSLGQIRQLHETFGKTLSSYAEAAAPARIVKLVAQNDQGHSMDAYFAFRSANEGWVALCAPDCASEFYFLINRQD